ncbi:hypothetical protein ANO14919_087850 [Xylariales sp. No.14919]|nr:hypothetical protein ANO14919_087850 [Xylariales sp. No.14919]
MSIDIDDYIFTHYFNPKDREEIKRIFSTTDPGLGHSAFAYMRHQATQFQVARRPLLMELGDALHFHVRLDGEMNGTGEASGSG